MTRTDSFGPGARSNAQGFCDNSFMNNSASSRFHTPETESTPRDRTLFRPSPMAYGGVVIIALTCLGPLYYAPRWGWIFWLIPIAFAWWVFRSRTQIDSAGITARTWKGSHSLRWDEVKGLNFPKMGGAQAVTVTDKRIALPAVGFNDLPRIAEVSGGRIPNPFDAPADSGESDLKRATRDAPRG